MTYILHIETATQVCSVALSLDEKILAVKETNIKNSHSSLLATFVQEILQESDILLDKLDAVAVSKGPGSYTGLRIGVSTAKGFCYSLDIPLIAIPTLQSMAVGAMKLYNNQKIQDDLPILFCPMIDAKRMEVYTSLFDRNISPITKTEAVIIEQNSFSEYFEKNKIILFGDGAIKCKGILGTRKNSLFLDDFQVSSRDMVPLAIKFFHESKFEDIAYFEPFYLKDFIAAKPRVKGLNS